MSFVVKNTTKWRLVDLLCPHSCRGCGQLGEVLCECCKNDIKRRREAICPFCKRARGEGGLRLAYGGRCECESPFAGVFVAGWREGAVAKLVQDLKYRSVRACGDAVAELLDAAIPQELGEAVRNAGGAHLALGAKESEQARPLVASGKLLRQPCFGNRSELPHPTPEEVVIVPLPTVGKHVRERGVDHTLLIAKKLAKRRGWRVEKVLGRAVDTVQVGAGARERREQAKKAYEVVKEVRPGVTYLLLDDVWTTGATMLAAAEAMKEAGATVLYAAVVETGRDKLKEGEEDTGGFGGGKS